MTDMSTKQVAEELGLARDTISAYAKQGLFLTAYQLGTQGPWRIPPSDIEKFRQYQRPSLRPRDKYAIEPGSHRAAAARKAAATRARRATK